MKKRCTHPAIVGGVCLDCGATVNGKNGANNGVAPPDEQMAQETPGQPENGGTAPKKTTRKRKA